MSRQDKGNRNKIPFIMCWILIYEIMSKIIHFFESKQESKNAQTTFTDNKNSPVKKASIPTVKNIGQFILGEKLFERTQ